ncbi:MAG: glutamyl-tRNA reductase, partial [Clostridia bacterium]
MSIVVMGVDHLTPVEIREKASYTSGEYQKACKYLQDEDAIEEFVILSTCNRSEVYCTLSHNEAGQKALFGFFSNFHGISEKDIRKYSFYKCDEQAVLHLFEVACGLKSLVIGEDQILGQIKTAHTEAMLRKNTSAVLNRLFFSAVTTAKSVKNCTGISKNSLSISSVGVKFIEEYFNGEIRDKKVLLIGTGKMGRLAVKKLLSAGVNSIIMTNRTHHHALQLQKEVKGTSIISYEERYQYINDVDVIISCTSSPHCTITYDKFYTIYDQRKEVCLLDLAVPRDIEREISSIKGVSLFTIDDLDKVVKRNLQNRYDYYEQAQDIIYASAKEFASWMEEYKRLETVKLLHSYGNEVLERQYRYAVKK